MKSLFVIIGAFLFAAASFGEAVEEMWHYDAAGGVACLPLVTDHNNDGQLSVLVVEHDTGMVRVLDHDGQFMFRLPRPNALSGSVVSAGRPGVFAFQEVTGRIHLLDYRGYHVYNAPVDSRPARSAGMCMADLDGDGQAEVLHARRDGVVTAFDQELVPRWRAYLGAPIVAPPAAAPVFLDSAAVYLRTADGALSAFDGRGKPLWRRSITRACTAPIPYATAPLIVQLAGKRPTVLITGADGRLVAVDAIDGSVTWAVQVGKSAAGAPAIADVNGNGTREIVVVDARGSIAVIGPDGTILRRSSLPSGDYVPRPLVADADGDGEMEIIIARRPWEIVVASLDGLVATTASLRGGASEGLVLHDIDRDGRLDLLAATDCGRVHCFSTHAKTGWTHPYANASLNGTVLPITPQPRPPVQRVRRRVHVRSVTLGENTVGGTFATAYVRIKEEKHARHARLTLRREEAILGSAIQPLTGSGLSVPFLTAERNTLLLDVTLLDENGAVVAASTGVPILSDPVELIDMPPIDPFLKALDAHAARFSLPTRWWPADANGKRFRFITNVTPDEWTARGIHAKTFIDNASPHPFGLTADAAQPCAPAVFAATRAQARARGLPWTLQIDNTFAGAITDTAYAPPDTGPQWQPPATATGFDCGHSPSLEFRLAMTGYLAGASALARPPQHAGLGLLHEKTPGQFTLGPFGGIASHIDAFAALYPQPGAPYTPVALVIDTTNPETPLAENELVRHVFAYDG
ncbi:MAG: PQQ-binding-like beta-propeller repeat protein, partial [Nitrospiraceae bacterium]|nr:PQQ-binding-like beta-propeller repeat protein [Nitrospiraceae bacterium]